MFTSNQIEEIRKKLQLVGIKDTELTNANSVRGDEIIAIVQQGQNKQLSIGTLIKKISGASSLDFANVSSDTDNEYTLEEAIELVDVFKRKQGQVITFINKNTKEWDIYQFVGKSLSEWSNTDLWKNLFDFNSNSIKGELPICVTIDGNSVQVGLTYSQGLTTDMSGGLTLKLATNPEGNSGGLNYDSTGLRINTGKGLQVKEGELTIKTGDGISLNSNGELVNTARIAVDDLLNENSENPVQNKVIAAPISKLMDKVFPTTFSVSGGSIYEKRTTQTITVNWALIRDGETLIPDKVTINGAIVVPTVSGKVYENVSQNTKYTVVATKDGKDYTGSTSVIFINPKYFGVVDTVDVTEAIIKNLSKTVSSGKGYTGTTSLNNQRTCYAYPKSFGALTAIKDANNFDYLASYVRTEITVWDEVYYVYVLKDSTTITNFKQIYS